MGEKASGKYVDVCVPVGNLSVFSILLLGNIVKNRPHKAVWIYNRMVENSKSALYTTVRPVLTATRYVRPPSLCQPVGQVPKSIH